MKTFSTLSLRLLALLAGALLGCPAGAQQHYEFHARDYVSTDAARAPQSAFSYDDAANTLSITGRLGANNVAFMMDVALSGKYYIDDAEEWFVVEGTNLRQAAASDALVWWFNGSNNGGQAPAETMGMEGGAQVFVWNARTNAQLNGKMAYGAGRTVLSANGAPIIHALGLTAASGTKATITNVGYYSRYGLFARYPSLMPSMGVTAEGLTQEVRAELEALVARARALNVASDAALEAAVAEAEAAVAQMGTSDFAAGYGCISRLKAAIEQYRAAHPVFSYERTSTGLLARYNDQYIRISFFADDVLRVQKSLTADEPQRKSMSVVAGALAAPAFSVEEQDGVVSMANDVMRVDYTLAAGTLRVVRRSDAMPLIAERGAAVFSPRQDGPHESHTLTSAFQLAADERIYGMGQIQDGNLNLRGLRYQLEIASLKVVIPYFQSSKHYALFWDNYSPTRFSDSDEGTTFSSTGNVIDYYILVADDADGVLAAERRLTGHSPMPPLWNFGLYQSRQRYTSAEQVMEVVRKYRELRVPLDCIVQDWQYWGDDAHWNALEFLNPSYANYAEMIRTVHDNHMKLMISVWSNFGPLTRPYAEMKQKGHLLTGNSYPYGAGVRPYDPWSSEARDIYWKYLYEGIASKGVDAYWMDSTEPDYQPIDGDADFDCLTGSGETWRAMRNTFPLAAVGGVHDHHRAAEAAGDSVLAGKRVSILTRSAFLGQQRYGANTWSSDIQANWPTLANQIPAALNFSACGIPYWNSDTGGFFGGDTQSAAWRRLFLRWVQFSCFTPMMRIHGDGNWREIYQFGSEHDAIGDYDQFLRYVKLRYRLLSYLYATAWRVASADRTFMQALALAFPDDAGGYDVKDEYLFGQSLLVAPVVTDNTSSRSVYLPATTTWTDFWTGEQLAGGQRIVKTAPVDIIPLYVRAGSILPWGPDVQYATEKPWDDLEVRVYPGADGTFVLYEDENDNYNYEQGQHSRITFRWDDAANRLTLSAREGSFPGMLQQRKFRIVRVSAARGTGDGHTPDTLISAVVDYDGREVSVELPDVDRPARIVDVTSEYLRNPSFEADGRALVKEAPQGWTVESTTTWWGVNYVGPTATQGDPAATDGHYIFGFWDNANTLRPSIYQDVLLPAGQYVLTADMHASNRATAVRVGRQRIFAGQAEALFADQVRAAGTSDSQPMQTLTLPFDVAEPAASLRLGAATDSAPTETWMKVDNFRLYRIERADTPDAIADIVTEATPSTVSSAIYTLQGQLVGQDAAHWHQLPAGLYVMGGHKVLKK